MKSNVQERVRQFTRDVLERSGALVDWDSEDASGMAVLPAPVAAALRCPEDLQLTDQPDGQGHFCANLATDFLERVQPLLADEPCVASLRIRDLHLKKADLRSAIERAFAWENARVTVTGTVIDRTEYHIWYFRTTINSEETWEEIVRVDLNSATDVVVQLPDVSEMAQVEPHPQSGSSATRSYQTAARQAATLMQTRSAAFLRKMEGRIERDRDRLKNYYDSLLKESEKTKRRTAKPMSEQDKLAKRETVRMELARKLDELDERYATTAEIAPVACISLEIPVLIGEIQVTRRKDSQLHRITWNPLTRQLEPMRCGGCGDQMFAVAFTDQTVEPRCLTCARRKS